MNIKKLSEKAIVPTKVRNTDAGYDIYSVESYELKCGERKAFKTDITFAIPNTLYGRVAPRSGLAVKKGIDVLAGVIDNSYRGELLVALINLGQEPVTINVGDKIAQIIFETYTNVTFNLVNDLDSTDRGNGGFGSSDLPTKNNIIPITSNGSHLYDASSKGEIAIPTNQEEVRERMPSLIEQYKKHESNTPVPYEQRIKEQSKDK